MSEKDPAYKKEKKQPARKSVTRVGNLTRDPELAYGASGTSYTRFGLAVKVPVNGDWSNAETEFYEVTCFQSLAENVAACLEKGNRAIVCGTPELDHWEDSEGEKRTTKRIVANDVGAELRFDLVSVQKTERRGAGKPDTTGDDIDEDSF